MPLKNAQLVIVEWIDSCGSSGWSAPEDFSELEPSACVSVGWLMRETETGVALAPHISNIDARDERVDGVFMIPKVAIKSWRVISTPEPGELAH